MRAISSPSPRRGGRSYATRRGPAPPVAAPLRCIGCGSSGVYPPRACGAPHRARGRGSASYRPRTLSWAGSLCTAEKLIQVALDARVTFRRAVLAFPHPAICTNVGVGEAEKHLPMTTEGIVFGKTPLGGAVAP